MPKDEFDFDDPFELNGMAMLTHQDTTNDMAECFIEEFMRLGYGHKQILALFRNPHYLGPNMALQKRGEPFIRELIAEVFACWGKAVTWTNATPNPLTPALSPLEGEGENPPPSHRDPETADCTSALGFSKTDSLLFPLPLRGGEGQGEGARGESEVKAPTQVIESDSSLTDPMGATIPQLNV